MIKKYKKTLILTILFTLAPIVLGVLLWEQLPDVIATHFGKNNEANGWSSKATAVFGIPLFLAAMQLICFVVTIHDPKKQNIGDKVIRLILWIVPICSWICCVPSYLIALGYKVNIGMVVSVFMGILFIVIGSYMHKIKHNYTIGIKIQWTLNSEENWERTHRMASRLWIAGGCVFTVCGALSLIEVLPIIVAVMVVVPVVYSFILYKKGI